MEIKEFIEVFASQFDETEPEVFTPDCEFHELEEWSSLLGFAILNVIAKKYGVKVMLAEMRNCKTIHDLYTIVQSRL